MRRFFGFFILFFIMSSSFAVDVESLYRKCKGCHGKYGKHAPYERQSGILAGRDQFELQVVMQAIRDGEYKKGRVNNIMQKAIKDFSDEDIIILSEFISKFKKEKTQ